MVSAEREKITIGQLAQKRRAKLDALHVVTPSVSYSIEKTNINHYHTKTGHGHAAEDANALADRLRGQKVELTGKSNEANGPDRIVDGIAVQTKYYNTAKGSVDSAFNQGQYRYPGQVLEVPKEQYQQALELMRERITKGQVPGVDDPSMAESIIKEGSLSYRQAVNIAKAGNIDSVVYDIKSRAVTTTFAFSLSFAITFVTLKREGVDTKEALRSSLIIGVRVAGVSLFTGVLTAQLLRTRLIGGVGKVAARNVIDIICETEFGRRFILNYASATTGAPTGVMAARNQAAKALRTNVVAGAITTIVLTSPDIYRAATSKSVSWAQVSKNLVVNGSGVAGGMAGAAAGAAAGVYIGTTVFPGLGSAAGGAIGGVLGSLGIGMGAGSLSKVLMDYIIVDDAEEMVELISEHLVPLMIDYLITESEVELVIEKVCDSITPELLRDMYQSESKETFVYNAFESIFEEFIRYRGAMVLPTTRHIVTAEAEFVAELEALELSVARGQLLEVLRASAEIAPVRDTDVTIISSERNGPVNASEDARDRNTTSTKASPWYRVGL